MFHADITTAVTNRPAVKPVISKKRLYYTNGNPAMGQPATVLDADHLNTMMDELLNVVEAAGLEPDKLDDTQLMMALRILIAKATGREEWNETDPTVGGMIPPGYISHLPHRYNRLPPGWYFCNGERYATESAVAKALQALPAELREDFRITATSSGVNVPDLFSGGKGTFFRSVDGVTRRPGSIEQDAMRLITAKTTNTNSTTNDLKATSTSSHNLKATSSGSATGGGGGSANGTFYAPSHTGGTGISLPATGVFSQGGSGIGLAEGGGRETQVKKVTMDLNLSGSAPSITVNTTLTGGITTTTNITGSLNVTTNSTTTITQSGAVADENRPLNIGMTPAIFLGV